VSQNWPTHPAWHLHRLGATHSPPFWHSNLHDAEDQSRRGGHTRGTDAGDRRGGQTRGTDAGDRRGGQTRGTDAGTDAGDRRGGQTRGTDAGDRREGQTRGTDARKDAGVKKHHVNWYLGRASFYKISAHFSSMFNTIIEAVVVINIYMKLVQTSASLVGK
jgi:hypothetical protein